MEELQKQKKAILEYAIDQLDSEVGLGAYIEFVNIFLLSL